MSHQSDSVGALEPERGQAFSDRIWQRHSTGGPAGKSSRLELDLLAHVDLPQAQSAEVVSDPASMAGVPFRPPHVLESTRGHQRRGHDPLELDRFQCQLGVHRRTRSMERVMRILCISMDPEATVDAWA